MEAAGEPEDAYSLGVRATCQWMAGVITTMRGPGGQPVSVFRPSPITGVQTKAYEELIAEEIRAAEQAVAASPPGDPGFVEGVLATLLWAWRRSGTPPIEVEPARTS